MPRRAGAAPGFTLIELMAVTLLLALASALVYPNLRLNTGSAMRAEAEDVASALELARQRAIMTGRRHRVYLDLDRQAYAVQWIPPLDAKLATDPEPEVDSIVRGLPPKLDLGPPRAQAEADFEPIPGTFGRERVLPDGVLVLEVEYPDVVQRFGEAVVDLHPDGSAEPAIIRVGDADGKQVYRVEIQALADAVWVERDGR